MTRTVEEYLQLPYRMEIYWDEDYWAVEFPELPFLAADADTWEDLGAAIAEAKRVYFASMLEDGKPIPEPGQSTPDFSGKLQVRLPKALHAQAARAAQRNEVSLNTFIVAAIAKEVGRDLATTSRRRKRSA
jgi:antitoxin HicB